MSSERLRIKEAAAMGRDAYGVKQCGIIIYMLTRTLQLSRFGLTSPSNPSPYLLQLTLNPLASFVWKSCIKVVYLTGFFESQCVREAELWNLPWQENDY